MVALLVPKASDTVGSEMVFTYSFSPAPLVSPGSSVLPVELNTTALPSGVNEI